MKITPAILIILDGFGHGAATPDNAIAQAKKPHLDQLLATCPNTLINASESFVGLPSGQMGNSEVGHLNIGAGRIVAQEFDRINIAIESGEFNQNPTLIEAVTKAKNSALHIFGLLSDGGIHSHQEHIFAMLKMAAKAGVTNIYVHAFLDGRDTPPRSAERYLAALEDVLRETGVGRIASVAGRFYAMDRDKRWERVAPAYQLVTDGVGEFSATDAQSALQAAYARDENDEFVKPTSVGEAVRIEDGDVVLYMNFRSDRARELSQAFLDADFAGFPRGRVPKLGGYYTLTQYSQSLAVTDVAFKPYAVRNGFGEYIAGLGLKQLRIAETEKYPHVTFFFNGGEETVYPGEERILVPSPEVATYDMQPEMHAPELTDKLVEAILSRKFDAIICNYANADMVGHTGNLQAAIKAIETLDTCVGRVVEAMQIIGGEVIITADHGNAEAMLDHIHHQAHTQHTTNLVPFIYVGRKASIAKTGALQDIAPTLLNMMGVPQPTEMTGKSLVTFA
ncbi:MAG: 2,3-bisphosphoglycerate-independent phosphoglycerate mutase [Methylophilaceae bacterium]